MVENVKIEIKNTQRAPINFIQYSTKLCGLDRMNALLFSFDLLGIRTIRSFERRQMKVVVCIVPFRGLKLLKTHDNLTLRDQSEFKLEGDGGGDGGENGVHEIFKKELEVGPESFEDKLRGGN